MGRAVVRRRDAAGTDEVPPQGLDGTEPAPDRDGLHGEIRRGEQVRGGLDPCAPHEPPRRETDLALEQAGEMSLAHRKADPFLLECIL